MVISLIMFLLSKECHVHRMLWKDDTHGVNAVVFQVWGGTALIVTVMNGTNYRRIIHAGGTTSLYHKLSCVWWR